MLSRHRCSGASSKAANHPSSLSRIQPPLHRTLLCPPTVLESSIAAIRAEAPSFPLFSNHGVLFPRLHDRIACRPSGAQTARARTAVVAATHELASPSRRMGVIRAIDEWHRSVVARACSRRGRRAFQPLPRLDTTMVVEIEVSAATGAEIRDPKICVYGGPDVPQGKRARLVTCSLRQRCVSEARRG